MLHAEALTLMMGILAPDTIWSADPPRATACSARSCLTTRNRWSVTGLRDSLMYPVHADACKCTLKSTKPNRLELYKCVLVDQDVGRYADKLDTIVSSQHTCQM